ncbi:MAG: hypothetical protein KGS60_11015 [Verrucomicrobia bacterium]|nr:hypothetical protein [Verrucomicrobiota bacterium]
MEDDVRKCTREAEPNLEILERQLANYANCTERLVDRRAEANRFYAGINTAIFGAAGFVLYGEGFKAGPQEYLLLLGLPLSGMILAHVWLCVLASQSKRLDAKYKIIHEIEKHLVVRPYLDEYKECEGLKHGSFERRMPQLFIVLHLFFFLFLMVQSGVLNQWMRWMEGKLGGS